MASYAVIAEYPEYVEGIVEFPEGKTWGDVKSWFVKWDTLHVEFKGDPPTYFDQELNSSGESDWKRPASVEVRNLNEDGYADYGSQPLDTEN